jgi:hypothetical protein
LASPLALSIDRCRFRLSAACLLVHAMPPKTSRKTTLLVDSRLNATATAPLTELSDEQLRSLFRGAMKSIMNGTASTWTSDVPNLEIYLDEGGFGWKLIIEMPP